MKRSFAIAILLTFVAKAGAQLLPSRNNVLAPLRDSASSGFLTYSHFYAEAMRGWLSAGGDRAWDGTIGGVVNIYRFGGGSIRIGFAQEMLANDLTGGGFNPRSTAWEQNIEYALPASGCDYMIGFSHRCVHDVDNSDPANTTVTPLLDSLPQKRVVYLAGFYGGAMSLPISIARHTDCIVYVRADLYPFHEDYRYPANATGVLWSNLWASAMLGARASLACSPLVLIYTLDWLNPVYATGGGWKMNANARAEAGMHLAGLVGGVDFFLSSEHLFDDLSVPLPRQSNTVSVGIRVE